MARSVAIYDGIVKDAIHEFKFNGKKKLSEKLGQLLTDYLTGREIPTEEIDLIVPIPLSKKREKGRGYNQSMLLAEVVSKEFGLKLDVASLKKAKDVKPQFELSRNERFVNIKGAFIASGLPDLNILLIDDIYTTGATVCEASLAVKNAGAKYVYVITLARAVEDQTICD